MKKLLFIVLGLWLMGCTGGGTVHKPEPPAMLPQEEIPAYREALIKMAPYVVLIDSAYHLEITKDKAMEMGVPEKYFERLQQDLDYTNYIVREEYNKKGIPIEMSEYNIATEHDSVPCSVIE